MGAVGGNVDYFGVVAGVQLGFRSGGHIEESDVAFLGFFAVDIEESAAVRREAGERAGFGGDQLGNRVIHANVESATDLESDNASVGRGPLVEGLFARRRGLTRRQQGNHVGRAAGRSIVDGAGATLGSVRLEFRHRTRARNGETVGALAEPVAGRKDDVTAIRANETPFSERFLAENSHPGQLVAAVRSAQIGHVAVSDEAIGMICRHSTWSRPDAAFSVATEVAYRPPAFGTSDCLVEVESAIGLSRGRERLVEVHVQKAVARWRTELGCEGFPPRAESKVIDRVRNSTIGIGW